MKKDLLGLLEGRETYVIGKDGTVKMVSPVPCRLGTLRCQKLLDHRLGHMHIHTPSTHHSFPPSMAHCLSQPDIQHSFFMYS